MSTRAMYGIGIGVVMVIAGLWATYQLDKDRFGRELAKELYLRHITLYFSIAGLLALTVVMVEMENVLTLLFPALVILGIAVQLNRIRKNPTMEQEAVIDLTRANQYRNGEALALAMLGGIALIGVLVVLIRDGQFEARFLAMGGLCLAFSAYFAANNKYAHTYITRESVSKGSEIVPWSQIESRYWGKDREDEVFLVLKRGGSLSRLMHLEIKVPAKMKRDVEKLLKDVMHNR